MVMKWVKEEFNPLRIEEIISSSRIRFLLPQAGQQGFWLLVCSQNMIWDLRTNSIVAS
jgi:hypothetical protein